MKNKMMSLLLVCMIVVTMMISSFSVYAQEGDSLVTIDILHTNDIHGRSAYVQDSVVGFEKLKTLVNDLQPDFVLDAGDTFHGQAFATLEQGKGIAELLQEIGYDAMTPGNHDWNYGKDRLKELGELAQTPILAANITAEGQNFFDNDGYIIKEIDGVTVGVFGVYDPAIQSATAPRNIEGLTFSDDVEIANQMAAHLREQGCQVVIALSHRLYCEEFIGKTKGIDLLIAGHEHAVMDESYQDADGNMVTVVEAGKYFENAGYLTLTYNTKSQAIEGIQERVFTAQAAEQVISDPNTSQIISAIQEREKEQLTQVIGSTGQDLEGRWEELRVAERNLGRVVTAAYLEETGADIAFENAGGIRIGRVLAAGDITYQDILDIAPYGNYIVTKQITGGEVLSILEQSIEIGIQNQKAYDEWMATGSDQVRWPDHNGDYLQFGGITVTYDPTKPQGHRVVTAKVGNEELKEDRVYTVATNNFISLGGTYTQLADVPEQNQFSSCDEALIRFIQKGEEKVNNAAQKIGLSEVEKTDSGTSSSTSSSDQTEETSSSLVESNPNPNPPQTGEQEWGFLAFLPMVCGVALITLRQQKTKRK